ncbi:MAG: response regulator [Planctomycetota bacterium]|nr:MAG: response regulator [Planctomycetota bacterium]
MQNSKPILLVEDDDVDVMTVKRALADLRVGNPLVHSANGEEALSYLTEQGNPKPCLILLDLNMPKMNGVELLKAIKADKMLKTIPVVVLTTSRSERDVTEIFENGVAGYVVKPADYKKFVEAIRTINLYWALSELPSRE